MKLGYLAYRNMISKPLNLVLSLLLLVLSVSLVTYVLQLSNQLNSQLNKNITPVDMVVGAKGSPLQLVLSSVLHIDVPTGNIKLKELHQFFQTHWTTITNQIAEATLIQVTREEIHIIL